MQRDASLTPARMARWGISLPRILKDFVIPTLVDPVLATLDPAHSYVSSERLRARVARVDAYMARRMLVTRADIDAGVDKQAFEVNNALVPAILTEPPRLVDLLEAALCRAKADDMDVLRENISRARLMQTIEDHWERLFYAAGYGGDDGIQLLGILPAHAHRWSSGEGRIPLLLGMLGARRVGEFVGIFKRVFANGHTLIRVYEMGLREKEAAVWHETGLIGELTRFAEEDVLKDFYNHLFDTVPTGSGPLLHRLAAIGVQDTPPLRAFMLNRLLPLLWELIDANDADDADDDATYYAALLKRLDIRVAVEVKKIRGLAMTCAHRTPTRPFLAILRAWCGPLADTHPLMAHLHGWAIQHGKEDLLDSIFPCRGNAYTCPYSATDGLAGHYYVRVTTAEEVRQRLDALVRIYPHMDDFAHALPVVFEGLTPAEWERLEGTAAWPLLSSLRYAFLLRSDTNDDARLWHLHRCTAAELHRNLSNTTYLAGHIDTMSTPCLDVVCDKVGTGLGMSMYIQFVARIGAPNALYAKLEHLFARYCAQPPDGMLSLIVYAVRSLKHAYGTAEMDRFVKKVTAYAALHAAAVSPHDEAIREKHRMTLF